MTDLLATLGAVAGLPMLVAGFLKSVDGLRRRSSRPSTHFVAAGEFSLGALLCFALVPLVAGMAAIAAYATFITYLVRNQKAGSTQDCGCFPGLGIGQNHRLGLGRNLTLLAASIAYTAIAIGTGSAWQGQAAGAVSILAGLLIATTSFLGYLMVDRLQSMIGKVPVGPLQGRRGDSP